MEDNIVGALVKDLEENIYCRLQPSPISGIGVFAIRDIPQGTNPFKNFLHNKFIEVDPDLVFKNEKIPSEVKRLVNEMWVVYEGKLNLYDGGLNALDISFFLNHSARNANVIAEHEGAVFVTARDVKKGEELLVDYGTYAENKDEGGI